jgi:putative copper export protein
MPYRKRQPRVATTHQRQTLPAVLYLGGVLLIINAWLVTQQPPGF